jgi:HTH-type transcriptional regulator / antitoxin HipB
MDIRRPEDLAIMVRDARGEQGMSQSALAKRAGVSRAWVVKLEQGQAGIELGLVLKALAAAGLVMRVGLDVRLPRQRTPLLEPRSKPPPEPRLPDGWREWGV